MKKNIIIGVLFLLSICFFLYSIIQKKEAEMQSGVALKLEEQLNRAVLDAERQMQLARAHVEEARRQNERAADCAKRK